MKRSAWNKLLRQKSQCPLSTNGVRKCYGFASVAKVPAHAIPTFRSSRMRAALIALALLFPSFAFAQQAWDENILTWTAHVTCSDGSSATNCPVTQYRIETAASATATTWDLVGFVPATPLRYVHTGVAAGPHCYRVKGVTADNFVTTASPVLANSCKTNTAPVPNPPGAVVVSDVTAYEVRKNSSGVMVASRIGVVPTGTVCTQETRLAKSVTYNRIDPAAVDLVNWPNVMPPKDVFAKCG